MISQITHNVKKKSEEIKMNYVQNILINLLMQKLKSIFNINILVLVSKRRH